MTEEAKAARREYRRNWQRNNPERVKRYQATYWERQAQRARKGNVENGKSENN